jgi:hypothetical protein
MRLTRRLGIATLALALLVLSATPAAARTPVDPNTLNPPPPDFFNAQCQSSGNGTICTLAFSDPDINGEPSGIVCGSTELVFSQTRSVVGKRFYDADGNLNQRHFRESFTGTFTNPVTHNVAIWNQHDTVIHNLAVPGDVTTGTTKVSGQLSRVWLPGGGTILSAAGVVLIEESSGEVIRSGGKHPFDDYFTGTNPDALAPLCDALA